ncbi:hypothetical protein ACNQ21_00965 [Mycoplasma sp. VS299A]|uniref:hypothetical protein n=1 Tax=Mycoplasma sp. VS299A TaxID=3401690 RepID=UPI003AAB8AED
MNKWSKRFLITGGVTFGASIIVLASVLGVYGQKKAKVIPPDNLHLDKERNEPITPSVDELDDITFKPNKIHIPQNPKKAFENRELLYVDLESSTPEKITWVRDAKKTYENISNSFSVLSETSDKNFKAMESRLLAIQNISQNRNVYSKLVSDIYWWNNNYNSLITQGTNNIIWDKKYLQDRLINTDLNSKNRLKDDLARYIISLHQYLSIFLKMLQTGDLSNVPKINIDNKTIDLNKSLSGVLTYQTAAKEFLSYLQSIVITSNNIEDVIWEVDDRMLKLENLLADLLATLSVNAHYLSIIENRELAGWFNLAYDNAFLSMSNTLETKNSIWEQNLIQNLQYDISLYNRNLTNEKFNLEAYLHFLNIKYKKLGESYISLMRKKNLGKEVNAVIEEFKQNQDKIDQIDQKYIKNKVIDQIINLRYLASALGQKGLDTIEQSKNKYYNFAGNKLKEAYQFAKENNDKYYENITESSPIQYTLMLLKARLKTIDSYLEGLKELQTNASHLSSEVPSISINVKAKIEQYKGYSDRLKTMIEENETILKNVPNDDLCNKIENNNEEIETLMVDSEYGIDFPAEGSYAMLSNNINNLLDNIAMVNMHITHELTKDWKLSCSVSDIDIDYIFKAYESGLKASQHEYVEFLKRTFNSINSNKDELNNQIEAHSAASKEFLAKSYEVQRQKTYAQLAALENELRQALDKMPKEINKKKVDPQTADYLVKGYKIILDSAIAFRTEKYIYNYGELDANKKLASELNLYMKRVDLNKKLASDLMYSLIKNV